MNISRPEKSISDLLKAISPPQRIQLLQAIGQNEACVCHLEALFPQWRQAYISQHLMVLRAAGVLTSRREGRFVFYSLRDRAILALLEDAARLSGTSLAELDQAKRCECPNCQSDTLEIASTEPG